MRSKYRMVLVALVAVFSFGALASAAMASDPEFQGSFPDKFELAASKVVLETVGKRSITCGVEALKASAIAGTGEITGAKAVTATFTFKFCSGSKTLKGTCTAVKPTELEGALAYVNSHHEAGLALKPKGSANFAEFNCGEGAEKETMKIKGAVIGVLTPVNAPETVLNLSFKQEAGVQKPIEYETEPSGKVKAILESEGSGKEAFAFEQTGAETSVAGGPVTITTTTATTVRARKLASRGLPEFIRGKEGNLPFTGSFLGRPYFEDAYGPFDYLSGSITGVITGPNEVANVVVTFNDPSEGGCLTSGKSVVTNALFGHLGYINKASKTVGLLLEPRVQPVTKCTVPYHTQEWRGSTLVRVTPGFESKIDFEPRLEKFEGEEVLHHLELIQEAQNRGLLSISATAKITEPFEIRS